MPLQMLESWKTPLRQWQQQFYEKYTAEMPHDALLVGVPGGGKTLAAVRLIHSHLAAGTVRSVIIVVPSVPLMYQWIDAAYHQGGIQLCPLDTRSMAQGTYPDDYHGLVTNYQTLQGKDGQLAIAHVLHHYHENVLIIVDEIHHAGTSLAWGAALENAFSRASYRVFLSGTPFRTDGIPLPFLLYDSMGNCVPFDVYTYAQGLTDRVCRRIVFPKYDGQLEYWNGEEIIQTTFRTPQSEKAARERLRAAVTTDWIEGVIRDAHTRLEVCRQNGHRDAGGLIVCMNDFHARKVAERVQRLTGTTPTIVTHIEEDAHDKIAEFAQSAAHWIVAVKLISEGVDIPRLRVGIYASNILTELYFWQFCGRFIRVIATLDCEQDAFIFIPSDPVLITYAQEIYNERERQLRQIVDEVIENDEDATFPVDDPELLRYRSIYGTGTSEQDGAIFLHGVEVTAQEYQWALGHVPANLQTELTLLAVILVFRTTQSGHASSPPPAPDPPQTQGEPNHRLRVAAMQQEYDLVQALRRRLLDLGKLTLSAEADKQFFQHFQATLNRLVGVKEKQGCSLDQFKRRELYIRQCIRSGSYAG